MRSSSSLPGTRRRHRPGALAPTLWGDENHVRELFGNRVERLETTRRTYVEHAASPTEYRRLFEETFGPLIALGAALADDADRARALAGDFADFTEHENRGGPGEAAAYHYDYLLAVARTRD